MAPTLRLLTAVGAMLLVSKAAVAQPVTAPPPHLALDEWVNEYKRLGLPLPPPDAELVRLKWRVDTPPCLGFRLPTTKPGDDPQYLLGATTYPWYPPGDRVKNAADALQDLEPDYVAELLCVAAQCRVRGLNEIAEALYVRGMEAVTEPVPAKWQDTVSKFVPNRIRTNGWKLHVEDNTRTAHLELRHEAFKYWHGKIMAPGADRREVLRYLRAADLGFHSDVRDLERTVAPRQSKPGTAEALIDDLIEYRTHDGTFTASPSLHNPHPGEAAYWKLAEMGFDAIPALLDHLQDSRFTRHPPGKHDCTGFSWRLVSPNHVGELTRHLVNHFAGDAIISAHPDDREEVARAWWEKARKVGEEKWLVALALPEAPDESFAPWGPDQVILRVLGVKYPNRLAEIYRAVLRKHPQVDSQALAAETVASKLSHAEQLALLLEGAEHKRLLHRNAALAILAKLDPPLFRKHLLATLKRLPPDVTMSWRPPQVDLADLLWKTDDPPCWEALTAATSWSPVDLRVEIIRIFNWSDPMASKPTRRELLQFLLGFLSDDSATKGNESQPAVCVQDVAVEALAKQLAIQWDHRPAYGPFSRALIRAAVAKAAAKEIARLKN